MTVPGEVKGIEEGEGEEREKCRRIRRRRLAA